MGVEVDISDLAQKKDNPSVLRKLGRMSPAEILASIPRSAPMADLEYLASTLDKPGRAVRSLASGRPAWESFKHLIPFSDAAGLSTPEGVPTGRDVLAGQKIFGRPNLIALSGLMTENKETGFHPLDDPKEALRDAFGFGAEIGMDPSSYTGLGLFSKFGALSKAGKTARAAGLLENAAAITKTAGTKGVREGLAKTTISKLIKAAPDPVDAFNKTTRALAGKGLIPKGQKWIPKSLADQPLGGLVELGIPGTNISKVFGGRDRFTGGLLHYADRVGAALAGGSVGRRVQQGFHQEALDTFTPQGQARAGMASDEFAHNTRGIRDETAQMSLALKKVPTQIRDAAGNWMDDPHGMMGDEGGRQIRAILEGQASPMRGTAVEQAVRKMKGGYASEIPAAQAVGRPQHELVDIAGTEFAPRGLSDPMGVGGQGSRGLNTFDPSQLQRMQGFKGIHGGTASLDDILRDPVIKTFTDAGDARRYVAKKYPGYFAPAPYVTLKRSPEAIKANLHDIAVAKAAGRKPPPVVSPTYQKRATGHDSLIQRQQELVDSIRGMPDEVARAGFGANHPVHEFQTHSIGSANANVAARHVLEETASHIQPKHLFPKDAKTVPVADVLNAAGLDTTVANGGVLNTLRRVNPSLARVPAKDILSRHIPEDIAHDLTHMVKGLQGPGPTGHLLSRADSTMNLSKAWWLGRPARISRDVTSGAIQNKMEGNLSGKEWLNSDRLVRGLDTPMKDIEKIPEIADTLTQRGLPHTPENAKEVLQQILYREQVGGKLDFNSLDNSGAGSPIRGQKSGQDLLASIPGENPLSLGRTLYDMIPKSLEQANPMNVRGVGHKASDYLPWNWGRKIDQPRDVTKNSYIKGFEDLGHYTDFQNRVPAILKLMREGVDSAVAKRMVDEAQVRYGHSTAFEKGIAKRAIPFYSFDRGMVPHTAKTLLQKPGGRLAQTIRATNSMRGDSVVPDHMRDSMNIPLGRGEDGSDNYISGFDMMHESALPYLRGNPVDIFKTLGGNLRPSLKTSAEILGGVSLFQQGYRHGRPLDEMDPPLGRLAANLLGRGTDSEPVNILGDEKASRFAEHLIGGSPLSGFIHAGKIATDQRDKSVLGKAIALGSGVKFATVTPQQRNAVLQKMNDEAMHEHGSYEYKQQTFTKEQLKKATPEERATMLELNRRRATISKQSKINKAAKQKLLKKNSSTELPDLKD